MTRRRLAPEVEREAHRLDARGLNVSEIARALACSRHAVINVLARVPRPPGPGEWDPSPARMSRDEREEIRAGLERGETFTAIAGTIGRAVSTVSREVAANGGRNGYKAWGAHQAAGRRARRPKSPKLNHGPLVALVTQWLEQWWSPEQIANRLRIEFPDDPMMWVSYETIYQSLFVEGRGELRRELHRCLRTGRAKRRPRRPADTRGQIPNKVMISDRPAEADDRAVPGHWEGDLIIGRNGASAIGTLVERTTRYLLLIHLPEGRTAIKVNEAITAAIKGLPDDLVRTLTWDQGKELSGHVQFTVDTGVAVYFCDPHSPWQRGSNENTNGLLRQYFPKGTDLNAHSAADLARAAASLNNRPRKTLGYMAPSAKLAEVLASTP
jgi:IS30 family transposase